MAFNRKESKEIPEEKIIEINARMQGALTFADPVNLRINGRYTGSLDTRGTLTIGSTAEVEANITGESVIVAGKINGNVIAKRMLVLMPTAVVHGDISTPKLNVVEGALFQGRCHMLEDVLSLEDLSQYLEIEIPDILELVTSGKIPAIKDQDSWKFERAQIEQWASLGRVKS